MSSTDLQDCSIIASTFERGAHATPSEAAVWVNLSRLLDNTSSIANSASSSLGSFIQTPSVTAATQAAGLVGSKIPSASASTSTTSIDSLLQGVGFGNIKSAITGQQIGGQVLEWMKECVPCSLRLQSFLELNPPLDLLSALEQDLKDRLAVLYSMVDMLSRFNSAFDICTLLDQFSFICIPDLQKIITLLMAQFLLDIPKLDGLIDILQKLIAPIFAPILLAVNALMSQFLQLVTNPIKCILDSLALQTRKIDPETSTSISSASADVRSELNSIQSDLSSSLGTIMDTMDEARKNIEAKMDFYLQEIEAMMGELNGGDASYLRAIMKKLMLIRQIQFISALIMAKIAGHDLCTRSSGQTPTRSQLDSFFDNFLNPRLPFRMRVDDGGNVLVEDKTGDEAEDDSAFNFDNIFNGSSDPSVTLSVQEIISNLSKPINTSLPCKVSTDDSTVNRWIAELDG